MFKSLARIAFSAAVAVSAAALPTAASAIVITSTTPDWSSVVGGSGITEGWNGSFYDIRWGTSTGSGQSGLGFDPTNPPSGDYAPDTNFMLGKLRHYNNPIAGGTAASSVDLGLLTSVSGAVPVTQSFAFRFLIDETPNAPPCAYPSTTPCADRITFQNLDLSSSFSIGGQNYTLALVGFSLDGGETISSFFDSQEGGTNTARLYARITAARNVPEPATLGLVGIALLSAGATGLRRKQRRQ
jgi:hypothetical protein